MGSAAVLAVYAAGFARTRAAAAAIEREATSRPARGSSAGPAPVHESVDSMPTVLIAPLVAAQAPAKDTANVPVNAAKANAAATPAMAKVDTALAATATAPAAPSKVHADSVVATPAPSAPAPVTPAPAADTAATPPAAAPAADTAARKPAPLHDGTFTGYGTSRHGDIEATIEIRDGRIVTATISKCLTRYSCSWIEMLPGQVVARQTADVDIVSGATQSSDAFYLAVTEALNNSRASGK